MYKFPNALSNENEAYVVHEKSTVTGNNFVLCFWWFYNNLLSKFTLYAAEHMANISDLIHMYHSNWILQNQDYAQNFFCTKYMARALQWTIC